MIFPATFVGQGSEMILIRKRDMSFDLFSVYYYNRFDILYLPKGTEHFLSDIHGEFKAFSHVLRNGSGAVRKKIDDVFGHTLSTADKMSLATLIY